MSSQVPGVRQRQCPIHRRQRLQYQGPQSQTAKAARRSQHEQKVEARQRYFFPFISKADVQGPYWPRNDKDTKEGKHADLASQSFEPEQPMEKVWQHYADKCGHKRKFPGPGAGVKDGAGNNKARYLMNFSGGSERNKTYRCTFGYNTDRYTDFIELASGWEDKSTGVEVTVGIR
jgi:hypothetical protein